MGAPHAHDDIELNLLFHGTMEYILNGHRLRVEPHRLLAFWAAIPHELVETTDAEFVFVTVPLTTFLSWSQAHSVLSALLRGQPMMGAEGAVSESVVRRWTTELADGTSVAAELEIQAALIRLASGPVGLPVPPAAQTAIDRMRRTIAERYAEDLTVAQVAGSAGLHPSHAMRVFQQATGATIGATILDYRLAHAKRLLAMTDLLIPILAAEAGFGSDRRLFEAFRHRVGLTPMQYRQRARSAAQGSGGTPA